MGKKDFDNLFKVLQSGLILVGGAGVSVEMDFELPRGYIAKIFKIVMSWIDLHEDTEGLTQWNLGVAMALLRDPDDTTLTAFPENSVQHDVVAAHSSSSFADDNGAAAIGSIGITETTKIIDIPEHIDLITARNMRWNAAGQGATSASLTESSANVQIHYTLEKVTDADILELLDIL